MINHGFPWVVLFFLVPFQPPGPEPCQVPVKQSNLTVPVETNRGNYTHFLVYTRSSFLVPKGAVWSLNLGVPTDDPSVLVPREGYDGLVAANESTL